MLEASPPPSLQELDAILDSAVIDSLSEVAGRSSSDASFAKAEGVSPSCIVTPISSYLLLDAGISVEDRAQSNSGASTSAQVSVATSSLSTFASGKATPSNSGASAFAVALPLQLQQAQLTANPSYTHPKLLWLLAFGLTRSSTAFHSHFSEDSSSFSEVSSEEEEHSRSL